MVKVGCVCVTEICTNPEFWITGAEWSIILCLLPFISLPCLTGMSKTICACIRFSTLSAAGRVAWLFACKWSQKKSRASLAQNKPKLKKIVKLMSFVRYVWVVLCEEKHPAVKFPLMASHNVLCSALFSLFEQLMHIDQQKENVK